ncbi:MAG: hypothetical protein AB1450_10725 [Pseudomonadota bacterium]
MMKQLMAGAVLLLGSVLPAMAAPDFNGKWFGDDGATYYVRHIGDEIYWFNEGGPEPSRTAIFSGRLRGQMLYGSWVDVPKGSAAARGELHLAIREEGNVLEVTRVTGGFPAKRISRAGYAPPPPPMEEKCLDFDPERIAVRQLEGRYQIVQEDWWIFDFGDHEADAHAAMKIIQQYGLNQSCFIGDPPAFRFLLISGRAPLGQWYEEDCVRFHPSTAGLVQRDGSWLIIDNGITLYDMGSHEKEARAALAAIRKHQFTHACFVGRPNVTFEYLRR